MLLGTVHQGGAAVEPTETYACQAGASHGDHNKEQWRGVCLTVFIGSQRLWTDLWAAIEQMAQMASEQSQ